MLVIWAPQSIADLQDIWDYIAEDNPRAATELVGAVRAKAEYLSRYPRLGRAGRGKQVRYVPVIGTPYFIVYRLSKANIEVLRVVHGARDWPRKSKRP
jgi:toxin ParE1/3/4